MAVDTIAALLRGADPDRYLSTLYAPAPLRPALQALYAFDADIGALRGRVREPMAGEIRLQWWRDALAAPPGEVTGNPVADALRAAVREHELPVAALHRLLEARVFDLYDDPMPDRGTLEGYLGETRSAVIQLAMRVLDAGAAQYFADAAGHGGCALGIAQILQALPAQRRQGQCHVPADILAAAGTSLEALLAGEAGAAGGVAAMVALGHEHLSRSREAARGLPPPLRPAMLPLASIDTFLAKTERLGARALETPARVSSVRRQWAMMRRASGRW